jgi:hypothetical protein
MGTIVMRILHLSQLCIMWLSEGVIAGKLRVLSYQLQCLIPKHGVTVERLSICAHDMRPREAIRHEDGAVF